MASAGEDRADRLGSSSLTLIILVGVSYVVNYAFYLLLSRFLPVDRFGAVGGYLAILGLLTLGSAAIMFSASRLVAANGGLAGAPGVRTAYLRRLLPLSALLGVAALVALVPMRLEESILLGTAALVPLRDLHCGLLGGLKLNLRFGIIVLLESFVRLGGALVTAWIPLAWIALLAWLVSLAFGTLLGIAFLPRQARARAPGPAGFGRATFEAILLRAPVVSFLNIDTVIAAALFGFTETTGLYVAAAILSRIPFFLATTQVIGDLPRIVEEGGQGPTTSGTLRFGLLVGALLALPLAFLPGLALGIAFGPSYAAAASLLSLLALTSFFLVQANTLSMVLFATGRGILSAALFTIRAAIGIALGIGLGVVRGPLGLAFATTVAAGATLVLLAVPTLVSRSFHRGQ